MLASIKLQEAEKAIRTAWQLAVLIGIVTAVLSVGGWFGADLTGLVDAVIVLGLAFGMYRKSRVASCLLVVYFVASTGYVLMTSGQVAPLLIRLFIAFALIRGCIATFRYQRLAQG